MDTAPTDSPMNDRLVPPARPSLWSAKTAWLLLFLAALLWSLAQAGVFTDDLLVNRGGWSQFVEFWQAAFQPVLAPQFLAITFQAMLVTLAYAVAGTFLSLLIGVVFGLLASELWWESVWPGRAFYRRGPWIGIRGVLAVPRGIHELIWGLFFISILGLDPLVAILAIAVPYGATVAKVFAEIVDEGERRPYLALLNSGVSPLKAFMYGLIPGVLADLLSYAFYRFECAIRAAAVLGVVGAGGLGYQILLSMQTLDYNETWTLFYALLLLSGLSDVWSGQVRSHLGRAGSAVEDFAPAAKNRHSRVAAGDGWLRWSLLLVIVLVPFSFFYLNPDWQLLWSGRTGALLQDLAAQARPLTITPAAVSHLLRLSQKTLAMSILAATLAALGGALLSFAAARNLFLPGGMMAAPRSRRRQRFGGGVVLLISRTALLLLRAIPAPIWALVLLFIFFPGILPGAIALGLYNLGVLGRLMAEVTENQDERPSRALKAQGASRGQLFFYGVLPMASTRYLALSLYRWEVAIRATVVVGLVGAGGLGRELTQQLSAFNYRAVLLTLIFYIVLTFVVDFISTAVRRSLR